MAPPPASMWLQRKAYWQASQSASAATSREVEPQAPACLPDRRHCCQCLGLKLGAMLQIQLMPALRGRPVLCENKLNVQKRMKEQKNHKIFEMRIDNWNVYSLQPCHTPLLGYQTEGGWLSELATLQTAARNLLTRCRQLWGLKSLASKNENKNTNISIHISACQKL